MVISVQFTAGSTDELVAQMINLINQFNAGKIVPLEMVTKAEIVKENTQEEGS